MRKTILSRIKVYEESILLQLIIRNCKVIAFVVNLYFYKNSNRNVVQIKK